MTIYVQNLFVIYFLNSFHFALFVAVSGAKKLLAFNGKKLSTEIQCKISKFQIPKEMLKLGKEIGKGHLGLVLKGQLVTPSGGLKSVAIKCLRGINCAEHTKFTHRLLVLTYSRVENLHDPFFFVLGW